METNDEEESYFKYQSNKGKNMISNDKSAETT